MSDHEEALPIVPSENPTPAPAEQQDLEHLPAPTKQDEIANPVYCDRISSNEFDTEGKKHTARELAKLALYRSEHPEIMPEKRQRTVAEALGLQTSGFNWFLVIFTVFVAIGYLYQESMTEYGCKHAAKFCHLQPAL